MVMKVFYTLILFMFISLLGQLFANTLVDIGFKRWKIVRDAFCFVCVCSIIGLFLFMFYVLLAEIWVGGII